MPFFLYFADFKENKIIKVKYKLTPSHNYVNIFPLLILP